MERSFVSGYKPYVKRHSFPKVRCNFWVLAWANGCSYDCAYCWLKAGYHPWPWTEIHKAERPAIARCLRSFCKGMGGSQLLNAGELCDSFIAPEYIPFMAGTLREANEEYGRDHRLLTLTKSADPWPLLKNQLQDVVVYSVSVNTESMAKAYENGAPAPQRRLRAAARLIEAGYEVRVRIDPIILALAGEGNANASSYLGLMERVCCFVEPHLVTLGCLRATPKTYRMLPERLKTQLTERTKWGRGYPLPARLAMYNELIDVAKAHGSPVALCKESPDVWRTLKLRGKCNCMG